MNLGALTGTTPDPVDWSRQFLVRPAWHGDALCREHPHVNFYPERGESSDPAKAICSRCAVRADCFEYAVANDIEAGVWGGEAGIGLRRAGIARRKQRRC